MFSPVNWEIVRKTSLMSASLRSSEIGSPVNWVTPSAIVRDWNAVSSLAFCVCSCCARTAAAAREDALFEAAAAVSSLRPAATAAPPS